jgi:hypothetical protein
MPDHPPEASENLLKPASLLVERIRESPCRTSEVSPGGEAEGEAKTERPDRVQPPGDGEDDAEKEKRRAQVTQPLGNAARTLGERLRVVQSGAVSDDALEGAR